MYAIYAGMSMIPTPAILKVILSRVPGLKIFPTHGYVRFAAFQRTGLKRFKQGTHVLTSLRTYVKSQAKVDTFFLTFYGSNI